MVLLVHSHGEVAGGLHLQVESHGLGLQEGAALQRHLQYGLALSSLHGHGLGQAVEVAAGGGLRLVYRHAGDAVVVGHGSHHLHIHGHYHLLYVGGCCGKRVVERVGARRIVFRPYQPDACLVVVEEVVVGAGGKCQRGCQGEECRCRIYHFTYFHIFPFFTFLLFYPFTFLSFHSRQTPGRCSGRAIHTRSCRVSRMRP